ncbi:oligosaccharide flippase family protein [Bacillus sinesaloumensis]|uniref:oligosaccharide flippase family protein n=1 Tax=Litchfieldia sinesaloumensis TaxID=1926280 RepID=UPI0009884220|nr:oligosaccharide flippase family protein [Bacillus sinesaloumensis]
MYKQSFYLSISKGLKSVSALVITMIIARVLSQNEYGVYRQFILYSTLLSGILYFGIPTAVSYLFKTINKQHISKLFTSTSILLLFINIFSALILVIFRDTFIDFVSKDGEILNYYYLLILYISSIIFFSFLENIFTSNNDGESFAKFNIIYFIIQLISFLYVSFIYKDLNIILILFVGLETIKGILLYFLFKRKNNIKFEFDTKLIKKEWVIAVPIGISFIAQSLNSYLGNMYVSREYSVDDFAVFSVGVTEIPFISIITLSIATAILPTLSEKYNKEKKPLEMLSIWNESTIISALLIFPIFWILFLFGDGYIEFIYSSEYIGAKSIFLIFLLKLPLAITVFGNILIVLNKSKYILFNMVAAIIINITLIIILDKVFSLEGVALAAILTQFSLVVLTLIEIKVSLKVKVKTLFPLIRLCKIFLISGITVAGCYSVSLLINFSNILSFFVFGGVSLFAVGIVFYFVGYLDKIIEKIKLKVRGKNE